MVGALVALIQNSRDQRAAQRERQRILREYEGKQSDRLVGRHGQGRPADEQQRPADCHAQAGAQVGQPPGDGDTSKVRVSQLSACATSIMSRNKQQLAPWSSTHPATCGASRRVSLATDVSGQAGGSARE